MSQMRMYCAGAGTLWIKVLSFNSSLDGEIAQSQTKQALHHFPRKATHQSVTFQAQFRDWPEMATFQSFVRRHQKYALSSPSNPEVVLWWPERGIQNWSGVIKRVEAGDKRFNVAPKVTFSVELVDSLLSEKTWWGSVADDFDRFFANDQQAGDEWKPPLPSLPAMDNPNRPTPGGGQFGGGGAGGDF